MKAETALRFKSIFEEQRKQLLRQHTAAAQQGHFSIQREDLADEVDLTSAELEQSVRMRLRNRELSYLKKIEAALKRIQSGTFGECDSCGDEIDLRRLEARPTTTLCISCKEAEERREHSFVSLVV